MTGYTMYLLSCDLRTRCCGLVVVVLSMSISYNVSGVCTCAGGGD